MTLTFFLIFGLATWRIASLFVQEDGPFFMFRRLRELTGIEHDDDGEIVLIPDTVFAGVLSCVWCCSIWVALAWTVLWLLFPEFSTILATPFALSAAAIWIDSRVKRD